MRKFLKFILNPAAFFAGPDAVALANELGGVYEHGRESLLIDSTTSLPVASKYLVYKRGSNQYSAAVADGAAMPLGVSPDAPYQLGDVLDIERFGATTGTQLGVSGGSVTIDNLVCSAPNGYVGDLTTAGHGTFWVIGRATKTVGAGGLDITFIPCFPYSVTQ